MRTRHVAVLFVLGVTGAIAAACSSTPDTALSGDTGGGGSGNGASAGGSSNVGGAATGPGVGGQGVGGQGVGGQGVGGSGAGGSSSAACTTDADCAKHLPPTTPPNCAVGTCDVVAKTCKFHPADADGDGHYAAGCTGTGVAPGDDCNDADPSVHAGAWDGPAGKDASGMVQVSACDMKDNDCDGKTDNGVLPDGSSCSCVVGKKQKCSQDTKGNPITWPAGAWPAGTPAPGSICAEGEQTCVDTSGVGQWGPCMGAAAPESRDCTSAKDNDCNGKVDDTETSYCPCSVQGKTETCTGNPMYPSSNCPGTATCGISADKTTSKWGDCNGPQLCACTNGKTQTCTMGLCSGEQVCANGTWGPCNDSTSTPIPSSCQCLPKQQKQCGGAACSATITCGPDYKWPPCPAPDNCACNTGDSKPCGGAPCQTTISCTAYQWPACPVPGDCTCNTPGTPVACDASEEGSCTGGTKPCDGNYHLGSCNLPSNCQCTSGQARDCTNASYCTSPGGQGCGGANQWDTTCSGGPHNCPQASYWTAGPSSCTYSWQSPVLVWESSQTSDQTTVVGPQTPPNTNEPTESGFDVEFDTFLYTSQSCCSPGGSPAGFAYCATAPITNKVSSGPSGSVTLNNADWPTNGSLGQHVMHTMHCPSGTSWYFYRLHSGACGIGNPGCSHKMQLNVTASATPNCSIY